MEYSVLHSTFQTATAQRDLQPIHAYYVDGRKIA
jgi:hypothetical protein